MSGQHRPPSHCFLKINVAFCLVTQHMAQSRVFCRRSQRRNLGAVWYRVWIYSSHVLTTDMTYIHCHWHALQLRKYEEQITDWWVLIHMRPVKHISRWVNWDRQGQVKQQRDRWAGVNSNRNRTSWADVDTSPAGSGHPVLRRHVEAWPRSTSWHNPAVVTAFHLTDSAAASFRPRRNQKGLADKDHCHFLPIPGAHAHFTVEMEQIDTRQTARCKLPQ